MQIRGMLDIDELSESAKSSQKILQKYTNASKLNQGDVAPREVLIAQKNRRTNKSAHGFYRSRKMIQDSGTEEKVSSFRGTRNGPDQPKSQ